MIVDTNYILMVKNQRYQELASKWLNNTISEEEKEEFAAWYNDNQDEDVFIESEFTHDEEEYRKYLLKKILLLTTSSKKNPKSSVNKKLWVCLAAAALCMVVIGVFLHTQQKDNNSYEVVDKDTTKKENNTTLSNNGPTITMANGKVITLANLKVGDTIEEKGIIVKKISSNAVQYATSKGVANKNNQLTYHTMSTPYGTDYQLVLLDGSKIWLNARSKLKFPVQLGREERRLELDGEAYFAINHSSQHEVIPFIVESRLQEVSVLGTEFNINAYSDEKWISTTLVNGAVKVKQSQNDATAVLKPNHQALIGSKTIKIKIKEVNATEVISWKEGYFNFNDSDIKSVLRQFARWYGVDVVYKRGHFPDAYVGKIPKSLSLKEALSVLETVGVKFKVENRKLIII